MATKLFLRGTTASDLSSDTDRLLDSTAGTSTFSNSVDTVAGPATVQFSTATPLSWWFAVDALTISGTITFNLWASESSMNNNAGMRCVIDRCDSVGAFISNIVSSDKGTELSTTIAAQNWTASPTSTAMAAGDYLRVRLYAKDAGGTMVAAANGASVNYGWDVTNTADTWVQFTETIVAGVFGPPTLPRDLRMNNPVYRM